MAVNWREAAIVIATIVNATINGRMDAALEVGGLIGASVVAISLLVKIPLVKRVLVNVIPRNLIVPVAQTLPSIVLTGTDFDGITTATATTVSATVPHFEEAGRTILVGFTLRGLGRHAGPFVVVGISIHSPYW